MRKTLLSLLSVLILATVALAQSTPYSTSVFSTTFNGPVTTQQSGTKGGTSTSVVYLAHNESSPFVYQALAVRTINAPGIAVDQASLEVYGNDILNGGLTQDDRQYITVQGHIAVYVNAHKTDEAGLLTRRRGLTIILNARTVIMVLQEAQASNDDGGVTNWTTLTGSLVINEKTCWLPEGCN
jgi:hypothetical protein